MFFTSFFDLYLSMFFILLLLSFIQISFAFRHHPSPFPGLSPGFYTHFILSAQPIAESFAILSFTTFPISSYRECYGFEWAFFTLRSFTDIFDSTCNYQGFPGARQFFLEVSRASYWYPRNTDPAYRFLWFIVILNLHTQNDSYLNFTIC